MAQGVGFLDFDNTAGFGPENYVLNADLTPDSEVYGEYRVLVVGFNTNEKTIPFTLTALVDGEVGARPPVFTIQT